MTRQFKTIADAVPHIVSEMHESEAELTAPFFTAAETAQLIKMYNTAARMRTKSKKTQQEYEAWRDRLKEWEKL